ncbi:MAG: replication-associated recombination protein A [Firmicutes bacterium]|nr:replication-associated recombination protein A [Bacillota bacterium]
MADDLFSQLGADERHKAAPLASRLRPRQLEEIVGQDHLIGQDGLLTAMARAHSLRSSIFYGPPGTGKTTVAEILARSQGWAYVALSAVATGIQDIRKVADQARDRWGMESRGTVLFLDEIHRFSKSQQDVLLPYIEDGTFVLLGATTENPWVSLNNALLSRCLLVEFRSLTPAEVVVILQRAWARRHEWWHEGIADNGVFEAIARRVHGDARLALTILERATLLADSLGVAHLTVPLLDRVWQDFAHYYDAQGDYHYDLASAFIKSIRGSDPDAALYWMGRMLQGGEDPRFIARRLLVHAAEDIGLADPRALLVAHAATFALETVGMPEARIPLAEAVLYLATAPKSHSVVAALAQLDDALKRWPDAPVPEELRDRHFNPRIQKPYRYPHDAPGHFLPDRHVPPEMGTLELYDPSDQGEEQGIAERLAWWRAQRAQEDQAGGADEHKS